MEALTCRLYPYAEAGGAANMATDELLAQHASQAGVAALRFYAWTPATLSLGYFQPAAARLSDALLASLPWVRRPSGGATLVHDRELTYALAVPAGRAWRSAEPWLTRMHRIIAEALRRLGLAGIEAASGPAVRHGDIRCFLQHTPGDLLCRGHKVVGSAQRKYRQTLLQHGAILLAQSEHTPALPGLLELTGVRVVAPVLAEAIVGALSADTGWRLEHVDWSDEDREARAALAARYASAGWNERR